MKNTFFDYPIFQLSDLEEFSSQIEGANEKGILVAIGDEMTDERRAYLEKILGAAKLNLAEDCLLLRGYFEISETKILPSLAQIKSSQSIKKVLSFGISPKNLGLNVQLPAYQPTQFSDIEFLFVDKLADIEPSKERRQALWAGLQKMFL